MKFCPYCRQFARSLHVLCTVIFAFEKAPDPNKLCVKGKISSQLQFCSLPFMIRRRNLVCTRSNQSTLLTQYPKFKQVFLIKYINQLFGWDVKRPTSDPIVCWFCPKRKRLHNDHQSKILWVKYWVEGGPSVQVTETFSLKFKLPAEFIYQIILLFT